MTTCKQPGCDGSFYCKGWCRFHYERQRKGLSLDAPRKAWNHGGTLCSHGDCSQRAVSQALCELHSRRARAGFPMDMEKWGHQALNRCSYDGCAATCGRSGLCSRHWRRVWTRTHGASRRAQRVAAFIEHVDVAVLRQLAAGRCGLCGEEVSAYAEWPDPMSQSIDHIVPLSRGGEHSYRNTQLAHVSCNARKGNRTPGKGNPSPEKGEARNDRTGDAAGDPAAIRA